MPSVPEAGTRKQEALLPTGWALEFSVRLFHVTKNSGVIPAGWSLEVEPHIPTSAARALRVVIMDIGRDHFSTLAA